MSLSFQILLWRFKCDHLIISQKPFSIQQHDLWTSNCFGENWYSNICGLFSLRTITSSTLQWWTLNLGVFALQPFIHHLLPGLKLSFTSQISSSFFYGVQFIYCLYLYIFFHFNVLGSTVCHLTRLINWTHWLFVCPTYTVLF